jgi:hypothetical protein
MLVRHHRASASGASGSMTGIVGVSMFFSGRAHSLHIKGPARAGDVLKALSEQVGSDAPLDAPCMSATPLPSPLNSCWHSGR